MADISLEDLMIALPIMRFTKEGQSFMDSIILDELNNNEDEDEEKSKNNIKNKCNDNSVDDEYIEVVLDDSKAPPTTSALPRTTPPTTSALPRTTPPTTSSLPRTTPPIIASLPKTALTKKRKAQKPVKIPNNIAEEKRKTTEEGELRRLLSEKTCKMSLPAPKPLYPTRVSSLQPTVPFRNETDDDIVTYMFNTISPLIAKHPKLAKSKQLEALVKQVLDSRAINISASQLLNSFNYIPHEVPVPQVPPPTEIAHSLPPATSSSLPLFSNFSHLAGTSAGTFTRLNPVLFEQFMNSIGTPNRI